jgi:hypothetical protein
MREVTIPNDYNPFVVKVNNVEYFYKAGETVEVPDEVADVIDRFNGAKVPEPEKLEYVEGFSYDPVADAGKVLQIRDDGRGIEWGKGSGGGESSAFDEWLGVTGYAEVTVNYTFPEGSEDTGLTGGSYYIQIGTYDEWDNMSPIYQFTIMNPELTAGSGSMTVIVPLIEGKISCISNFSLDATEAYYSYNLSDATYTGNITIDTNNGLIVVSGDGAITSHLVSD